TGIQSIPSIVAQSTGSTPPPLVDSPIPKTFSYGILIVSQGVYFFSYFLIVRFLASRVLATLVPLVPKKRTVRKIVPGLIDALTDARAPHVFFHVVLILLGFGVSWIFAESFWGSIPDLIEKTDPKNGHPVFLFLPLAAIGNI